jgi:hypothetical protein
MKLADTNPDKPVEEILKEIEYQAQFGLGGRPGDAFVVFGPLSALLVKLSRSAAETADKAAETAEKTFKFTQYLFWTTIVLLAITILLVGLEFMKFNESGHGDPKSNQTQDKNAREISKLPSPTAEQPKGGPKGMDLLK